MNIIEKDFFLNIFRGGPGKHFCSGRENFFLENNTLELDIRKEFLKQLENPSFLSKFSELKRKLIYDFYIIKKEEIKKRLWENFENIIDNLNDKDAIKLYDKLRKNKDDIGFFLNYLHDFNKFGYKKKRKILNKTREECELNNFKCYLPENINLENILWNDIDMSSYKNKNFDRINKEINKLWHIYITCNILNANKCQNKEIIEDILHRLIKKEYERIEYFEGKKKIALCDLLSIRERKYKDITNDEDDTSENGNTTINNYSDNFFFENNDLKNDKNFLLNKKSDNEVINGYNDESIEKNCVHENENITNASKKNYINNSQNVNKNFTNALKCINKTSSIKKDDCTLYNINNIYEKENALIQTKGNEKIVLNTKVHSKNNKTLQESKINIGLDSQKDSSNTLINEKDAIVHIGSKDIKTEHWKENELVFDFLLNSIRGEIKLKIKNFVKVHQVGQGAYGDVWMAEDITHNKRVALKKLKLNGDKEGLAKTYIREISILNSLKHENIVELIGVVHSKLPFDEDLQNQYSVCTEYKKNIYCNKYNKKEKKKFEMVSKNNTMEGNNLYNLNKKDTDLVRGKKKTKKYRRKSSLISASYSHSSSYSSSSDSSLDSLSSSSYCSSSYDSSSSFKSYKKKKEKKSSIWMVFEYVPFDLSGYSEVLREEREKKDRYKSGNLFTIGEIKNLFMQLLKALDYCHKNNIIHRDIKIANLLIDKNGVLKLADFGLARFHSDINSSNMTNRVITLWYRPPELLLGSENYLSSVDMWSCGCVLAELLTSNPLFSADNESDILKMIVNKIGFPNDKDLKYLKNLPYWNSLNFNPIHPNNINNINLNKKLEIENSIRSIPGVGDLGLDLLKKFLKWNPFERITANDALNHPWFKISPYSEKIHQRNNIRAAHSFMTKNYKKRDPSKISYRKNQENFRFLNVGNYRKAFFFNKYNEQFLHSVSSQNPILKKFPFSSG